MSIINKYLFAGLFFVLSLTAWGQARSPFTTFGVGEAYGSSLIHNQGMGGVGVAQPQYWFLNNQNPALLVYNSFTVFSAGLVAERRTLSNDTASEKSTGGNMNYLATAFPIKPNRWTTSVGLMPFSTVNYQLNYVDGIENSTNQVSVQEEGTGGITQLYWSNGVRLTKEIAIGVKASYLFSSIVNTYKNQLINSPQPANYQAAIEEKSYVRDFSFSAGVSFSKDSLFSRKKYRLSFGAVYDFAADLNTNRTDLLFRTTNVGGVIDSVTLPSSRKGSIYIPGAITAGIALNRGAKWTVAAEMSYRDWSSFESVSEENNEKLGESYKVALGGEITPDAFAVDNYLKRVTYRMGVSMERYPYMPNYRSMRDLGINFGFSLPAGRSSIDMAFKYGKRGNKADNLLEEDYFKVYFGITFNDQWFIKRKFD